MFGKRKAAALLAEFLGTGILTLLILSVQRSTIGVPFFIASAAGLVLALMMFAFETSGGFFNPAITIGMWFARRATAVASISYIIVQLLGGWAAFGIYKYFSNGKLTAVGGGFTARILIAELVGTAIFGFGYAAAVYKRANATNTTGSSSAYVGLAYTLGIIAASSASLGLINPAVALGVNAWDIWGSMGWLTYVLGPVLGAIIGINLYDLVFAAEGESFNLLALSTSRTTTAPVVAVRPARTKAVKKPGPKRRTTTTRKRS
jgi:glycerol uptake facilitator-like aquaporin